MFSNLHLKREREVCGDFCARPFVGSKRGLLPQLEVIHTLLLIHPERNRRDILLGGFLAPEWPGGVTECDTIDQEVVLVGSNDHW